MRLSIYGNTVKDNLVYTESFLKDHNNISNGHMIDLGGVFNLLKADTSDYEDFKFNLATTIAPREIDLNNIESYWLNKRKVEEFRIFNVMDMPVSYIIVTPDSRTSFTDWQRTVYVSMTKFDPFKASDWNHFMYGDTLHWLKKTKIPEEIRKQKNSIDFSGIIRTFDEKTREQTLKRLKGIMPFIDIAFVSTKDFGLFSDIFDNIRGSVVMHDDISMIHIGKDKKSSGSIPVLEKVSGNTVGAGDIFALYTILETFYSGTESLEKDWKNILYRASEKTKELIKKRRISYV